MSIPKLRLELDALHVESFDTDAAASGLGTVHGQQMRTLAPCNTFERCASFDGPCNGTNGYSCAGNCFQTYETDCLTCAGTCTEPTCRNDIVCRNPTIWPPETCGCPRE